jgi:hypothetical protein
MTQRRPVVSRRRAEGLLAADQQKRASDFVVRLLLARNGPPRALYVTRRKRSRGRPDGGNTRAWRSVWNNLRGIESCRLNKTGRFCNCFR